MSKSTAGSERRMPSGGAILAELLQPGFLLKLARSPASAVLLAMAAAIAAGSGASGWSTKWSGMKRVE